MAMELDGLTFQTLEPGGNEGTYMFCFGTEQSIYLVNSSTMQYYTGMRIRIRSDPLILGCGIRIRCFFQRIRLRIRIRILPVTTDI